MAGFSRTVSIVWPAYAWIRVADVCEPFYAPQFVLVARYPSATGAHSTCT